MDKNSLNNIRIMFDKIDENLLKIECLGYLVQSIVLNEQIYDGEFDFGTLTIILNNTIKQSRRKILRLDRYLMKLKTK